MRSCRTPGLAHLLGFTPLPATFFLLLFAMVVVYLVLVEVAKIPFYRPAPRPESATGPHPRRKAGARRRPSGLALLRPPAAAGTGGHPAIETRGHLPACRNPGTLVRRRPAPG